MSHVISRFSLLTLEGTSITKTDSIGYLGATLNENGKISSELGRRLGIAWADFRNLLQVWNHVPIPLQRREQIFNAVILPQIMYGLSSSWLCVADRRRLDGFQARCLRKLLRLAPSFVSRTSNRTVLQWAKQTQFSSHLLKQQLLLYGRVARAPDNDVLRRMTFMPGTLQPVTERFFRKLGRPRHEWASQLTKEALSFAGTYASLEAMLSDECRWYQAVQRYRL